jgi:hypothetical protein
MDIRMALAADAGTHWLIAHPILEVLKLSETAIESIKKGFNAVTRKGIVKGCAALNDDEVGRLL